MPKALFQNITFAQSYILLALAQYKFLTASQLVDLGIMRQRKNINHNLRLFKTGAKPLLASQSFGAIPKIGKLEHIHFLTIWGKKVLREELGLETNDIKLPQGSQKLFYQDYFHRKYTIDCEIALHQWAVKANIAVLFSHRYFDKVGNQRKQGNLRPQVSFKIGQETYIIPDGLFQLLLPNGREEIYCLEMYNGQDKGRTIKQLEKHLTLLEKGNLSDFYGIPYAHKVLCVFEKEALRKTVWEYLAENPVFTHFKAHFLGRSLASVQAGSFGKDWRNLKGETVDIWGQMLSTNSHTNTIPL